MLIFPDESKKNFTPEINQLFQELANYEEAWNGKITDNDYWAPKVKILNSLIIELVSKNQQLLDKILWANIQLDTLVQASINYWMQERLAEKLVSRKKNPKDVPLKDIKKLLDSVREEITEIDKELMAGINLSK